MISLNLIAYLLYGTLTCMITVVVGWLCYKNGIHYIKEEIQEDQLAHMLNRMLLLGYYLINLGYCALMIYHWKPVLSLQVLIETVSNKTAYILLSIGCMHYLNISLIYFLRKKKIIHP